MNTKKKIITLICLSLVTLPFFLNQVTNTEAYYTGHHRNMINDGLFLINRDFIDDYSSDAYYQELLNCFQEIRTSNQPGSYPYFEAIEAGNAFSDSNVFLQLEHHWDPIELRAFIDTVGAPYMIEQYFYYAIKCYLYAEEGLTAIPTELDQYLDTALCGNLIFDELDAYDNNYERAYFLLGMCLHILQDVTDPAHACYTIERARLWPYTNPSHDDIEAKLNDYYNEKFDDDSTTPLQTYWYWNNDIDFGPKEDWEGNYNAKGWVHQAALVGYSCYDSILWYDSSTTTFRNTADFLIKYAVSITAGFMFYFWQYAHSYSDMSSYLIDFDQDGLLIKEEEEYHADYTEIHSDTDGLTDFQEVRTHETDPSIIDTDGDNLDDFEEVNYGVDNYITNPLNPDSDYDGLNDAHESVFNTNPWDPDCDDDGLNDYQEVWVECTDAWHPDTDRDGYTDYDEVVIYGTNPLYASSNPGTWTPHAVTGFIGITDTRTKITFVWNRPDNYITGWVFKIYRKSSTSAYSLIRTTTAIAYTHYPPSIYTTYTYRIACYNANGIAGPYSYWTGAVIIQGGGGGGGFF